MFKSVKSIICDAVWGRKNEPNVTNCEPLENDQMDPELDKSDEPASDFFVSFIEMLAPFKDDGLEESVKVCQDFLNSPHFQKELHEKRIPANGTIKPSRSNHQTIILLIQFLETGNADKIIGDLYYFEEVLRIFRAFAVNQAVAILMKLHQYNYEPSGVTESDLESLTYEPQNLVSNRKPPLLDGIMGPKEGGIFFIHPKTKILLCSKDQEFEIGLEVARESKGLLRLFMESIKESSAFTGASSQEAPICKFDLREYKPAVLQLFALISDPALPEEQVKCHFISGAYASSSYENILQLSRFVRQYRCHRVAKYIQDYRLIEPILWCIPHLSCRKPPLSKEALCELLEHIDYYEKSEFELFLDLLRYSQERKGLEESLQEYMADFVKKIRFSRISIQEYLEKIQPRNVLQPQVLETIEHEYFSRFTKCHPHFLGDKLTSRYASLQPTWKYSSEDLEFLTMNLSGEQTLWLKPNKSFYLLGIQFYGSKEKRLNLVNLRLEIERFGSYLATYEDSQAYLQKDEEPFQIYFKDPIEIDAPCKISIHSLGASLYATTHTGLIGNEIATSLISCDFFTASIKSGGSEMHENQKYFLTKFSGLLYSPAWKESSLGKLEHVKS